MEPNKLKQDDRIFVLRPKEGLKAKNSLGLIDARLFTGENKLHAVMDPANCMWHMKYDEGVVPTPLQGKFTNFSSLKRIAESYFGTRNVEVIEIID